MALSVDFSRKNCLKDGCLSANGRMDKGAWPAYKFVHGISFWKKARWPWIIGSHGKGIICLIGCTGQGRFFYILFLVN
jgi:hypothetical protein